MVKFYSQGCPKCNVLAKKLEQKGIEFEEIDDQSVINEVADKAGIRSLPLLDVDDELMTFEQAVRWVNGK